jgi:hypothetical protein
VPATVLDQDINGCLGQNAPGELRLAGASCAVVSLRSTTATPKRPSGARARSCRRQIIDQRGKRMQND